MGNPTDDALRRMMRGGRVPLTSLTAVDLATTYGSRVQGIKITAGTGTMTITYKDHLGGSTPKTETVRVGEVLLDEFTSIDSVSNITELVVLIAPVASA